MFAVISLYTSELHCYLVLLCAWSLSSLLFPTDMQMVSILAYASFVRKERSFLFDKCGGAWPGRALYREAVTLDPANVISNEPECDNDPDDDTQTGGAIRHSDIFTPAQLLPFDCFIFPCPPESPQVTFLAPHKPIVTISHLLPLMQ